MIWVLVLCIGFFSVFCGSLLLRSTGISKTVIWFLIILIIPSILLYIYLGRPSLPDHPYERIQQLTTPTEVLEARDQIVLQQELVRQTPDDAKAWYQLGDLYIQTKQFYKAALTYREAWKLAPDAYDYKLAYTHALIFFNNGKVTPTTLKLLKELHKENPKDMYVSHLLHAGENDVG